MVHIYICQDLSRHQFPWRLCFSCSYPGGHLAKRFGACSSFQPSHVRTSSNHIGKTTYTSPNLIYNILQCPFWEVYLGSDHAIEESLNLNSAATATACAGKPPFVSDVLRLEAIDPWLSCCIPSGKISLGQGMVKVKLCWLMLVKQ